MVKQEQKERYQAPELTVVNIQVEQGFALSGMGAFSYLLFWENNEPTQMEDYSTSNGWSSGNNTFWD